jgi:DNA (cytosine-5)-methyltransferase 1
MTHRYQRWRSRTPFAERLQSHESLELPTSTSGILAGEVKANFTQLRDFLSRAAFVPCKEWTTRAHCKRRLATPLRTAPPPKDWRYIVARTLAGSAENTTPEREIIPPLRSGAKLPAAGPLPAPLALASHYGVLPMTFFSEDPRGRATPLPHLGRYARHLGEQVLAFRRERSNGCTLDEARDSGRGSMTTFGILDLFCGTGAISYGLHAHDPRFTVLGGIDIDSAACGTAKANHPHGTFLCESIIDLTPRQFVDRVGVSKIDMIVGGPPCQGFSSLRPNRQSNINDPRNQLYRYFIDYVRYCEPTVFLMENVIGLVSESRGRLLGSIMRKFQKLGYSVDWRVLNAANYGVPQKRERVILAGVKTSKRFLPELHFPKPTHFFNGRVIGTSQKQNYVVNFFDGEPALTVADAISDLPLLEAGQQKTRYAAAPKNSYQRERRKGGSRTVTLHIAANHNDKMLRVIRLAGSSKYALPTGIVSSGFSSCYSRMEADQPATTITVKFTSPASNKCIHPFQNRAITPREAARLQGFDDTFVFCGSKTEIASQIGNAVPPLLGQALAPMFLEHLEARSNAR